jgi:hypothetical protein
VGDSGGGNDATSGVDGATTGLDGAAQQDATGLQDVATGGDGATTDGAAACTPKAPCTPTSPVACAVYGTDCSTGHPLCVQVANVPAGQACGTGNICNAAGNCVACQDGASCVPTATPCYSGTISCATGACTASATALANGATCGTDAVCDVGVCVSCKANQPCTPSAGACVQGHTDCSTGSQTCVAIGPVADGTPCGTGQVCSAGACGACVSSASCTPTNPCHTGGLACSSSTTCIDTGSQPDNVYCDVEELCTAGTCGSAGSWITRGEDNRTFSGGYVFTFTTENATVSPTTSTTQAFVPSPGGRTGNALQVSGVEPKPTTNVYPLAALAWTFTSTTTAFNASAMGSGIDIWIKSAYAGTIQVLVEDVWTTPAFGFCSTDMSAPDLCYNFPEHDCNITTPGVWTEFLIPWTSFVRQNYGTNTLSAGMPLDPTQVVQMQINVPPTSISSVSAVTYNFAVDDVRYTP